MSNISSATQKNPADHSWVDCTVQFNKRIDSTWISDLQFALHARLLTLLFTSKHVSIITKADAQFACNHVPVLAFALHQHACQQHHWSRCIAGVAIGRRHMHVWCQYTICSLALAALSMFSYWLCKFDNTHVSSNGLTVPRPIQSTCFLMWQLARRNSAASYAEPHVHDRQ